MREWLDDVALRIRAAAKASIIFLFVAVPAAIAGSIFLQHANSGLGTMFVLTGWFLVMHMARTWAVAAYHRELEAE